MLIGLHGKARSGKDTAYRFIEAWAQEQGVPVRREGFADRLKLSAYRLFHPEGTLAEALAWCDTFKEDGSLRQAMVTDGDVQYVTGRQFLQRYGTEAHRDLFGFDFWVDAVLPKSDDESYFWGEIMVITDVRFKNEAERVRRLGGQVWQLVRPDEAPVEAHSSEQPLPDTLTDCTITNDRSLDHLQDLVMSRLDREWFAESVVRHFGKGHFGG